MMDMCLYLSGFPTYTNSVASSRRATNFIPCEPRERVGRTTKAPPIVGAAGVSVNVASAPPVADLWRPSHVAD